MGLQTRLLLIVALVLGSSLGAMGWSQDRSFKAAVRAATEEQLRTVAYGLLAAADEGDDGLRFAAELGEPRLNQPNSGLYAYLASSVGDTIWRSPSIVASGSRVAERSPLGQRPAPGEHVFGSAATIDGEPKRFALGYTVIWEALSTEMTIWVLADQTPYREQITEFRRDLAVALLLAAAAFMVVQLIAVRWGLRPIRHMVSRLHGLEAGTRNDIGDDYPRELAALARNLNRFIASEKANRERHRNAMDDLAHSLKTPLAVLKNALRELDKKQSQLFDEQLTRMESTVAHQLSRAAAVRPTIATHRIALLPAALRIANALERAYAEKAMAVKPVDEAAAEAFVKVDERDLMEMLGNLIENAFKYGRSQVRLSTSVSLSDNRSAPATAMLLVEDDGPGIAPDKRDLVLKRGERADLETSGQGIGLAVVVELAAFYEGRLAIGESELGGAAVRLSLPAAEGG